MVSRDDDVYNDLTRVHRVLITRSGDNHVLTRLSNLATLMCAPAAPLILPDFSSTDQIYETLLISIWELGEAFGPLLIAPLSEVYGRAPIYHGANVLFCVFSIASTLSRIIDILIAFRVFNGITMASAVPDPSIIGYLFSLEKSERDVYPSLAPLFGPLLGPIAGGYISA